MSLSSIDLGLREVLADPIRRQAFFRTITEDDIAAQIRALRKARGLTQTKFADLAGMKQSAVSRIEQAEYASWTLATLFRVAAALDARWRMILEPAEDAVKQFEGIENEDVAHAPEASAVAAPNTGIQATGDSDLIRRFWSDANKAAQGTSAQSELGLLLRAAPDQRPPQPSDALNWFRAPTDSGGRPAQQRWALVSFGP